MQGSYYYEVHSYCSLNKNYILSCMYIKKYIFMTEMPFVTPPNIARWQIVSSLSQIISFICIAKLRTGQLLSV